MVIPKTILKIWWISLFIKLVLAAIIPFSFDEAYYWIWAKHLQLSYFDHPPMVAWLLWLGNFLFDFGQAVRWPTVFIGHGTLFIWLLIFQAFGDLEKYKQWLWLALCSPLLGFGSILSTPDVGVVFFWSCSTYFSLRILSGTKMRDFIFLGAALGLGFCAKYHIALFVPALLLYLTFEKKWKLASLTGITLTILFGLLFSFPVLWWNYQNDFRSFLFQINHGFGKTSWSIDISIGYVLSQILLIFPTVLWMAMKFKSSNEKKLLLYLSWFPLAFFLLSSFRGPVEPNWPIIAYPSILAVAVLYRKNYWGYTLANVFWLVLGAVVMIHFTTPILKNAPEKLEESRYFQAILDVEKNHSPLYLGSYQMASMISYHKKKIYKKLYQINRHDFFDELYPQPPSEKNFYVVKEHWIDFPGWLSTDLYDYKKLKDIPPKFELYEINKK